MHFFILLLSWGLGYRICRRAVVIFPCLSIDSLSMQSKIEKIVAAMGGMLISKASTDVSFVVVKNVLAAKYKVKYFVSFSPFKNLIMG